MLKFKIYILNKLLDSLLLDAFILNSHILADRVIVIQDAMKEVGWLRERHSGNTR